MTGTPDKRPTVVVVEVAVTIRRDGGHTVIAERKELRYPPAMPEPEAAQVAVTEVSALVLGKLG